jgi:hypothetical protein
MLLLCSASDNIEGGGGITGEKDGGRGEGGVLEDVDCNKWIRGSFPS